jgi:hypothetical protein
MAISDTQKVDYLFKKLAWGVAKTDTNPPKEANNEDLASPLLIRGDLIWQQSASIPASIPSTTSSIVQVYKDTPGSWTATVQAVEDATATARRVWRTSLGDWIPVEFGATYLVKVYVDTTGSTTPQTTGTQLGAGGATSSSDDQWFFDYQAGVLSFIGTNLPSTVTAGKSIFISGARYIGDKGFGSTYSNSNVASYLPTFSGNLTAGNVTINAGGIYSNNFYYGNGTAFTSSNYGNTQVAAYLVAQGIDGTGIVASDTFTGDGTTTAFNLSQISTTTGTIVSINGVMQIPTLGYSVSGNVLTLTEAPVSTDVIEARTVVSTPIVELSYSNSNVAAYLPTYRAALTANNFNANSVYAGTIGNTGAIHTGASATFTGNVVVGNISSTGSIVAGTFSPGQVIKDLMLSNSEVTVSSATIATSGSSTNFITYNYTPTSSSSYLMVHIHISKYVPGGTTDDSWFSQLLVDGNEIAYGWQKVNDDGTGTSGRSGVLFPLTGRYTNTSTSAKQIQVAARRDSADDSIVIDNSSTAIWLRITEVAR